MTEHTPTPWAALPDEFGNETYIVGPKSDHPVADCQFGFGVEDDANAAFIVHAVNSHDAMLREIDRLQEAKRRALAVADERAKEANELRQRIEVLETSETNELHRLRALVNRPRF